MDLTDDLRIYDSIGGTLEKKDKDHVEKIEKSQKNKDSESEDSESEDSESEDSESEDLRNEDLESEDLESEDLKKEDLKSEDLKKEDLESEDLKKEDLENEDFKKENLEISYDDSSSIISDDNDENFIKDIEETEKINKIDIIKILKEKNNINIFNIDSLHYYYDDLFSYNNDSLYNNNKIKDLVNKHLSLLDDEIEKNEVFYLNHEKVKYKLFNKFNLDKVNLLNNLKLEKNIEIYNNIINDITNNILVYSSTNNKNLKNTNNTLINLYKREFYLSELKIPEDCILNIKTRYINVENESLISKLDKIEEERDKEIIFLENNFNHINDIMIRNNKDFFNMNIEEYDKIPEIKEKIKKKKKEIIDLNESEWIIKKDNIIDNIGNIDIEINNEEIDKLINEMGEIKTNLENNLKNGLLYEEEILYNNKKIKYYNYNNLEKDIENENIDIDIVIKNINDYLKLKSIIHSILYLNDLKKYDKDNINIEEYKDKLKIIEQFDNILLEKLVIDKEILEIIESEENNEDIDLNNEIYDIDIDISDDNKNIINKNIILLEPDMELKYSYNYKNNIELYNNINNILKKYIFNLIEYSGLNVDISEILSKSIKILRNNMDELELFSIFFINWYIYIYEEELEDNLDVVLNSECINLWQRTKPIEFIDKGYNYDSKSIMSYIICCLENLELDINIDKLFDKIYHIYINNNEISNKLLYLLEYYNSKIKNKTNDDIYLNILLKLKKGLEKDDINVKSKYTQALLYLPLKLNRVNNYIMGCCKQLLNKNFRAFTDLDNSKQLKYIKDYMKNYKKINKDKWKSIKYIKNNLNIDKDIDKDKDKDENKDDINIEEKEIINNKINIITFINENFENFPIEMLKFKNDSELNNIVENNIKNYLSYISINNKKNNQIFINIIKEKCKFVDILKKFIQISLQISHNFADKAKEYNNYINKLENQCCQDKIFYNKRQNIYKILGSYYITDINFNNNEIADEFYKRCLNILNKNIPTRIELNDLINKYREETKIKAINKLQNKNKYEKDLDKELKKMGIIDYMQNDENNNENNDENKDENNDENNDDIINYKGEDENFIDLY